MISSKKDSLRSLTRSTFLFSAATLCSRVLGYARDAVNAGLFGASALSDAFFVAYRFPNMLRDLLAEGALSMAFVPTLSQYLAKGEHRRAVELTHALFTMLLAVATVVVSLGVLGAPFLVRLLAPGLEAEVSELTIRLTRWLFPFIGFIGAAAVLMGFLNAQGQFTVSAFAPAVLNVVMIITGVWICPLAGPDPKRQLWVWTMGALVGALMQLAVQIPSAWKRGFRFTWVWQPAHAGLRQIRKLMAPMVFSNSVNYINILVVNTYLASLHGEAVITYLNYAFRLMQLPMGLFGVAVASVALPALSLHAAEEDEEGFRETLSYALRSMFFWVMPAAVGLAVLSHPITALLFQRGAFEADDVAKTALAATWYAGGLIGLAGSKVLNQGFYAMGNTRTPMMIGLATVVLNVALSLGLGFTGLGFYALPAANSLAALFNFSVLWWCLNQGIHHLDTAAVRASLLKIAVASGAMGAAVWGMMQMRASVAWQVTGGVGIGMTVFIVMAWGWKMPEAAEVWRALRLKKS